MNIKSPYYEINERAQRIFAKLLAAAPLCVRDSTLTVDHCLEGIMLRVVTEAGSGKRAADYRLISHRDFMRFPPDRVGEIVEIRLGLALWGLELTITEAPQGDGV